MSGSSRAGWLRAQTYQNWIFVSVVKGGAAANALVKSLESEWGARLYGRTLISNIGNAVYKDRDAIVKGLKGQIKSTLAMSNMAPQARLMEPLLNQPVSSFQFAFKIRVRPSQQHGVRRPAVRSRARELPRAEQPPLLLLRCCCLPRRPCLAFVHLLCAGQEQAR